MYKIAIIYIYIYTFIFHIVAPSHGRPLWTRGNWWCNKYVSSSIRGHPWEGGRMEWWTSESCSSSNLNKGWTSILVLGLNWNRPGMARPSLTKDGRARSSFPWFNLCVRKSLWFSNPKLLQSPIKRRFRYHNFHNGYESHNPRSGYITTPRMLYKHGPA